MDLDEFKHSEKHSEWESQGHVYYERPWLLKPIPGGCQFHNSTKSSRCISIGGMGRQRFIIVESPENYAKHLS